MPSPRRSPASGSPPRGTCPVCLARKQPLAAPRAKRGPARRQAWLPNAAQPGHRAAAPARPPEASP
eukprot:scaffold20310_cov125-Isochrysis_galbana.AAC.22